MKKWLKREKEKVKGNLVMGRWGLTSTTPLTLARFPISPNALRFFPSATPFFFCCFPPPITASPGKSQPNHTFKRWQNASDLNTQIHKIAPTTIKKSTMENLLVWKDRWVTERDLYTKIEKIETCPLYK